MTTFLQNMCGNPNCTRVSTLFRSAASFRVQQQRKQLSELWNTAAAAATNSTGRGGQAAAPSPANRPRGVTASDVDVLRELSPIHQFVITENTSELASVSGVEDDRSVSPNSLDFEVESDRGDSTRPAATNARIVPLNGFLMRQEQAHQAKQRRLDALMKQTAPSLKPVICEHSRVIAASYSTANTNSVHQDEGVDGVASASHTKSAVKIPTRQQHHRSLRRSAPIPPTFQPVITSTGASHPARGFDDMHRDNARRIEKLDSAIHKKTVVELNACTFEPQTNKQRNAHVESTLTPKNFHIYQEQLEKHRVEQENRREEQRRQEIVTEFSACTFKPKVTKAPAYISRMTTSTHTVQKSILEVERTPNKSLTPVK